MGAGNFHVLALIGESCAGKSTIGLTALANGRGGVRITGGEVKLNGEDLLKLSPSGIRKVRGAKECYVAQSAAAAFNPAHRLGEQVIEASLKHGIMNRAEAEKHALYLFKVLGLPNPETFGQRYPHQVSTKSVADGNGNDVDREIPLVKAYSVFNIEQIDGLPETYYDPSAKVRDPVERIESAERFFRDTGVVIRHGGNQAYYSPVMDYIQMPPIEAFRDAAGYAAVLSHEATH